MNWTTEFVELINSANLNDAQFEKAFALKRIHLPRKIYKYRAINDYALKNIESDSVWLCSPDSYNDPYDSAITCAYEEGAKIAFRRAFDTIIEGVGLDQQLSPQQIALARVSEDPMLSIARELVKGNSSILPEEREAAALSFVDDWKKFIRTRNADRLLAAQRNVRLCSFSVKSDSIVMWSHYANHHKGVCIEYSVEELSDGDFRKEMLFPVLYSSALFSVTSFFEAEMSGVQPRSNLAALLASLHKSPEWAYEEEWRLVLPSGLAGKDSNVPMPTPSRIFLGCRMSDPDRERLIKLCRSKGIEVHRMEMDNSAFRLTAHITS